MLEPSGADEPGEGDARHHTQHAAHTRQHSRFGEKLPEDDLFPATDNLRNYCCGTLFEAVNEDIV